MSVLKIAIISILFILLNISEIEEYSYASIIDILMKTSVVMVSSFFILYINKKLSETNNIYLYSVVILILVTTVVLSKLGYYGISQNISTSLLLANVYSLFYILIDRIFNSSLIKKIMIFFIIIVFIGNIYYYTNKIIKKSFNVNENIKIIYIEAGAAIERENAYKILSAIKDCNKFKELQKMGLELDNEVKNNKLFKNIYDESKRLLLQYNNNNEPHK